MILTILWISFWSLITIFAFLLILVLRTLCIRKVTTYNRRNHNSAFSNPFENTSRRKQAEEDLKEYIIKWKVLPELWSIKSITAKPTNAYHKTNWDFYIEFTFLGMTGYGSHLNNISIFDLTIEPSKNIFSIKRQFVDIFTQLTSVANRYADDRNTLRMQRVRSTTTVENLKKQYNRDQKLKQLGL